MFALLGFLAFSPAMLGDTILKIETCVVDKWSDNLQSHYDYFAKHDDIKNNTMVLMSVYSDALLIVFLSIWVARGGTCRFLVALGLNYVVKLTMA